MYLFLCVYFYRERSVSALYNIATIARIALVVKPRVKQVAWLSALGLLGSFCVFWMFGRDFEFLF